MDYMSQLPPDRRNVEQENAMDCFRRTIDYSRQDHRERVQMKRQSYAHLKLAAIHLDCRSMCPLAQENYFPLMEAEKHLCIIRLKFGDTIPMATRMLFSKTQSDLLYHQGQCEPAKVMAEDAFRCASSLGYKTEVNACKKKKDFYQKKPETCVQIQGFH